jgi:putative NIF3 family GTP cyclohydrolase 1 type 2
MREDGIPVKVLEGLVREVVKWMEVHRPVDASREETTRWVLSAAFSAVSVAGAACASIGALGAEIAEDQFVAIAREAFRRAQRPTAGGASPDALA